MFPQSFLHYHIVILPSQPTCYSVYLWYIRNIKHISTGDWVQFTCWWFGVVLSQVIPSEVQDSTGDNIEKPGKTLNGETSMCIHILNFVCPLISSVDGESSFFSSYFWFGVPFVLLSLHQTWLLYFLFLLSSRFLLASLCFSVCCCGVFMSGPKPW